MNPEITPPTAPVAVNKKLLVTVSLLCVVLVAVGVFLYTRKGDNPSLSSGSGETATSMTPKMLSPSELSEVQKNFMKNFRPGCALETPSDIIFPSGRIVTAYFAKCGQGYAQKSYKAGVFLGRDAVMEIDQSVKIEVPLMVILSKSVANGSSTILMSEISKAQADYFTGLAKLTGAQKDFAKNLQMHTNVVDGYIVVYNIGKDGPYFDESSMHIK